MSHTKIITLAICLTSLNPIFLTPDTLAATLNIKESATKRKQKTPVQRYINICLDCHWHGIMDSPRFGSKKDWAPRIEKGMETLYNHAIHGFNSMPARGTCTECTDDDIKALVDYMVKKARR